MDSATTINQTASRIRSAVITVKGKAIAIQSDDTVFGIGFRRPEAVGTLSVMIDAISLTVWKNETYLDTGLMLFGPIDDQAAKTINELITPVLH